MTEAQTQPKRIDWWSRQRRNLKKSKYLLFLALPGFFYFVIFKYIPMYGVTIAFKEYNSFLGILRSPWIGFDNFIRFFQHPYFWKLLRNTFLLSFYSLLFGFPSCIIFALALNEISSATYKKTVQTISFLPHFIAMPAIVGMLFLILSPSTGFINVILNRIFGIKPIYFMLKPEWFRTIYIASGIWQGLGWGAIIYLAQLSRINTDLYEAADIDGAKRLQKMWHISLPGLKPIITIILIMSMGRILNVGAQKVILMYNPATYETADVIGSFVYRRGLQMGDFSYGTAVGLFNTIIGFILVVTANQIAKKVSEFSLF